MLETCVVYNILQLANMRSGRKHPIEKIVDTMGIVLENASISGIHYVELAKSIIPSLFKLNIPRQELDASEQDTRSKAS